MTVRICFSQLKNPVTKFDRVSWVKFVINFYQNIQKTTIKSREWWKLIQNTALVMKRDAHYGHKYGIILVSDVF